VIAGDFVIDAADLPFHIHGIEAIPFNHVVTSLFSETKKPTLR
jgi:hypothetical protein